MSEAIPQRLYLFLLGMTTIPRPTQPLIMSSGCYLVQMSDGRNILIDTCLPPDYVPPVGSPPTEQPKNVLEHLAALDLTPDDIDLLICTHFDIDHAGYNDAFTNAEHIVQRSHYELARRGGTRLDEARPHWDHPALHYRLIDGDTELLPGLTLLETSGHVDGHQSVLIRLPQTGLVLLTIDAVMFERIFAPERTASPVEDEQKLRASTRKLLDLVEHQQVKLVVFGHDGRQWQSLKTAPDYYE